MLQTTKQPQQNYVMDAETIKKTLNPKRMMSRIIIMRRVLLFFITFTICVGNAFAQDVIILRNGEEIQALVHEIGEIDVQYKKFENLEGPTYTMKKSEILIIWYANGSKDIFSEEVKPDDAKNVSVSENSERNTEMVYISKSAQSNKDVIVRRGSFNGWIKRNISTQKTDTTLL